MKSMKNKDIEATLWELLAYYYEADQTGAMEDAHIPIRDLCKLLVDLKKHGANTDQLDVSELMKSLTK